MNKQLKVKVNQREAGLLVKEGETFIFNYCSTDKNDFVSLAMPVRARSYEYSRLLPIFEMHLPEGYLLAIIKKQFSKLTATDDFGLLQLLAPSIKGRVHYQKNKELSAKPLVLDDLIHPKQEKLFDELVQRFALQSPLSGVQPKVLAKVENKATLKLDEYIVKAWGEDYPELALNEYFCMMAVKIAGIPVPEFYLSDDERLFIMKRFDIDEQGRSLGFEDMCVLQAKQRDDKYTGSYEQVAKTIRLFTAPAYKVASLQQFFKMLVLNNRLQNGDAHLKNFGIIYEDIEHVRLAPAYDVASTTAYIKKDIAALNLLGSKKWWSRPFLIRFGKESCDLTESRANSLYDECEVALKQVSTLLKERLLHEKNKAKQDVITHLISVAD
ncbi:MAG: type II toxin-antitoxin system HipA family toxin [Methyloprofundus sp.]|nr:type II toxin-antitoxin system HipA family toxin [Methyloprofundus sp.]